MSTKFSKTKEQKEAKQLTPHYLGEGVDKTDDAESNDSVLGVYEGPIQKKSENKNSRVYTEEFWNNFFQDEAQQQRLEDGLMLGRVMHPDDGVNFDLNKTSHVVTDVWDGAEFNELDDELIYGTVEVLNTEAGQNLQTMLDAGVKLGISSRSAVYSEKEDGKEYISEGDIYGWDFVYDPSVEEAVPERVESVENSGILVPFNESRETLIESIESIESESNDTAQVICEAIDSEPEQTNESDDSNTEDNSMSDKVDAEDLDFEEAVESIPAVESEVNDMVETIDEQEEKIEELETEVDERTERAKKAFERQREKYENLMERAESLGEYQEEQKKQIREEAKSHLEEAKEVYQTDLREARDIYQNDLQEAKQVYQELKQKAEQFAEEIRSQHQEKVGKLESLLEETKEDYQELKQESNEKAKSFYVDYILQDLNESDNDRLRGLLEQADSADEIDEIVGRIEEAQEAIEDQLPIGSAHDEKRKQAIESVEEDLENERDDEVQEEKERLEGVAKYLT